MMGDTANMLGPRTLGEVGRALAGDLTHGRTPTLYRGPRTRALRHDGALGAVRDQPEDRLQVARAVRGRRTRGTRRSEPRASRVPPPDLARGRAADRCRAGGAPELGPAEAPRLARASVPGARAPSREYGGRSPGAARAREEAPSAAPAHPPRGRPGGHARA